MISWGWVLVAFLVGVCAGALLMGICVTNSLEENRKRKWWEE